MQKLDSFEFIQTPHNKYDWSTLFDGSIWQMKQGEDFQTLPTRFCSTVYAAAKMRGLKVRTCRLPDGVTVVLQATGYVTV